MARIEGQCTTRRMVWDYCSCARQKLCCCSQSNGTGAFERDNFYRASCIFARRIAIGQILEARHMAEGVHNVQRMVFNARCMQANCLCSLCFAEHWNTYVCPYTYLVLLVCRRGSGPSCEPDSCSTTCSTQCTGSAETCGCLTTNAQVFLYFPFLKFARNFLMYVVNAHCSPPVWPASCQLVRLYLSCISRY